VLAVALAIGSLSSVAGAAEGPEESEQAQKRPAGHHCWYRGVAESGPDHWHGSGWYWCGARLNSERRGPSSERREPSEHRETRSKRHQRPQPHVSAPNVSKRPQPARRARHRYGAKAPVTGYPQYYYPTQQYYTYPR
jgi:hypothetical protein